MRFLAQAEIPTVVTGAEMVDTFSKTVSLLVWVVLLLILIPVAVIVYRKLFLTLSGDGEAKPAPARAAPDPNGEALRLETRGDTVGAAKLLEAAGDMERAAALYERGREFGRAAELYEDLDDLEKAAALHLRSGGSLRAAGIYVQLGNYLEAAKIFRNKGDHLRSAQALEMLGNRVAAARAYEQAGEFARAAGLYREEGLPAEAAGAYGKPLEGTPVTPENLEEFATWAAFLLFAGDHLAAKPLYERILAIDPGHERARAHLEAILAREEPGPGEGAAAREIEDRMAVEAAGSDPLSRKVTLRHMTTHGRLEPRDCLKLWLQMLKALAARHGEGMFFGSITPEQVLIDMRNAVTIEPSAVRHPDYVAPEVRDGVPPDQAADIYAMGALLYEMVTGSINGKGATKASSINRDAPPWMDGLIDRCLARDRRDRFRSMKEITEALVRLRKAS